MVTYAKRFTMFSLLILIAHLGMAYQPPPRVTISMKNATMQQVFDEINKQTGLIVFYSSAHLNAREKISLQFTNEQLDKVMNLILKDKPLTYEIDQKFILIRAKPYKPAADSQKAFSLPPSPLVENEPGDEAIPPIEIRGRVLDESGQPVAGASVLVKGTTNGTSTDANGYFTLNNVDEKATLVITSVNIEPIEVKVNGRSSITVSAKTAVKEEEIVVAYGTRTRTNNTGAVTVVKGEQIQNLPNRSFDKSLQGLVPGLLVSQGTGQPGGGLANFVLRGIATGADPSFGSTARNPLIVMDGVPLFQDHTSLGSPETAPNNNPLAQLNPSDIESITVLKDAAAIALYGAKASNGVILVTTKKGTEGKMRIGFRSQVDFAERLDGQQDVLNQQEYLALVFETFKNTDPLYWTDFRIDSTLKSKFPTKSDDSFYPQNDWLSTLYRNSAVTVANELSFSGGNSRQTFYLNLEYTKQNGIERNTGFDRKSIRFNYENKPAGWIKLGLNTTASYNIQNVGMGRSEAVAMRISPLNPIRDETGEYIYNYLWGGTSSSDLSSDPSFWANPAAAQQLNFYRNQSFRGLSKLYGEIKFLKYFTFSPSVGADFMLTETKYKVHPKLSVGFGYADGSGAISGQNFRTANLINSNILRYDRNIAAHHSINILIAHEAQIRTNNTLRLDKTDIGTNPNTEELLAGAVSYGYGLSMREKLLSYFGQANYGFRERYFLSGSLRRDGSSFFGENNLFGTHWSAGAGWVVSSEPFLRSVSNWLSYLKIRGSLGSAGNSAAIINTMRYHWLDMITFNGQTTVIPTTFSAPNPSIQWEKTYTWNLGTDIRLFKERLALSADIYKRKTSKLIGSTVLAPATGYSSSRTNIGDLKNHGFELTFSADIIKTENIRWNLNGNWSANINRLVKSFYPMETVTTGAGIVPGVDPNSIIVNGEGENYNSFYLVRWAGVDPMTGQPQWIDSTGKQTSNWSAAKQEFVGKPQPDGFGSLSQTLTWKDVSLFALFNYQYGFQVYADPVNNPLVNDGLDPFANQGKSALDRWQKPGDKASNPRRLLYGSILGVSDDATRPSTRYLLDGDFIRLSTISLSYQLPKKLTDRLHMSNGRIYIQGSNLATWTKYSGRQDSENANATGLIYSVYPLQRTYSIGINLNF